MKSQKITPDFLKEIAIFLGDNWQYNEIISSNEKYSGHYLSNRNGLLINVKNVYGEKLPQWRLQYQNPQYKNHNQYINFFSIGSSLDKQKKAIAKDIKNRLLVKQNEALEKRKALFDEAAKKEKQKEQEQYIIDSLSKVLNLNPTYNHRYDSSYRIEENNGARIATLDKWSNKGDCFSLTIDKLNAEQIIKIMQIANP